MESARPKTTTGKLARGTTRTQQPPPPKRDLNIKVKQLVAPMPLTIPSKEIVTTNLNKPDVHLRSDLLKPTEPYSIFSPKRAKESPKSKKPELDIDDESKYGPEKFNFDEMVRIGRPERDLTLKQPLMRKLQALRRYKMGTSPSLKAGLLRETLAPIIKDPSTKRLLDGLSPRGRPVSPFLASQLNDPSASGTMYAADDQGGELQPVYTSTSGKQPTTAEEEETRKLVIKQGSDVNLHLYHLSAQGKRNAKAKATAHIPSEPMTEGLLTDSFASSALPTEEDAGNAEHAVPVMYDPATVRLPRMEIVPGFGSTTPLVESRLGAYRVHSSKAVSAAAALEEASLQEGSRALSMNSRQGGGDGGDSYQADRVESFYRSAETSHLNSLEDKNNSQELQHPQRSKKKNHAAMSPRSLSTNVTQESSVKSPQLTADPVPPIQPEDVPVEPERPIRKNGLHCGKCFRDADMWCTQCVSAFCAVCWGQVPHHDLRQMSPSRARPSTTDASRSPSPTNLPSPKKTYARSVMFQSYASNTAPVPGAQLENSKYSMSAAAKIPLPDYVVTQYDQYPAPPVYIDGKGHVLEDIILRRPVTAPVTTQEELHKLQMSNHFKRRSQQEQYNSMLALKYKAATAGIPSTPLAGSISAPTLGVSSGIHYEPVEPRPMTHSKGRVVVKRNKKKHPVLRPTSPSLVATANGTLALGYSPKPRTGTKPMSGILKDGTPVDWKTALFASNDIPQQQETGRNSGSKGRTPG